LKLHADAPSSLNTVTAYGPDFIEINQVRHATSVILTPDQPVLPWEPAAFEALTAQHFEALRGYAPDLVVFGTGARQRFPHPRLTAALAASRIGIEVMDTQAACRTYNILMSEGRRVLAAILLESHSGAANRPRQPTHMDTR
jgi:uncharacterized protein